MEQCLNQPTPPMKPKKSHRDGITVRQGSIFTASIRKRKPKRFTRKKQRQIIRYAGKSTSVPPCKPLAPHQRLLAACDQPPTSPDAEMDALLSAARPGDTSPEDTLHRVLTEEKEAKLPGNSKSGNSTSRRGKPPVQRIRLTKETASKLRLLLAQRNTLRQQPMSEEQLVEELIEREWYATT